MYTPKSFEENDTSEIHNLMQRYPLATIVALTQEGLEANHIPLLLKTGLDGSDFLFGHFARANLLWKKLPSLSEVLVIFQGPDHYISPNYYPSKKIHGEVVPTWNYIAVHIHGTLEWVEDIVWLEKLLHELTDHHEASQNAPWRFSDAPEAYRTKLMAAIIGCRIRINSIQAKWKVSQNRDAADRDGVVRALNSLHNVRSLEMADAIKQKSPTES